MLTVISPAKKLDDAAALPAGFEASTPYFERETKALAKVAQELSADDLQELMHISPKLAELNRARFAQFEEAELKPAVFFFAGDTYTGLEAKSLSQDALRYAGHHLRILSGLYGVLRPLDMMAAYRLEMGSKLANPKGRDLYAYWRDLIAARLNEEGEAIGAKALLNCASTEYFGAVDTAALKLPVITPVFWEDQPDGSGKIVSFHAKKARGAMARFVMEHRITTLEDLRDFNTGGYRFDPSASEGLRMVFRRGAV